MWVRRWGGAMWVRVGWKGQGGGGSGSFNLRPHTFTYIHSLPLVEHTHTQVIDADSHT